MDYKHELAFTGEYCIPGKTPTRIEADHLARYRFAVRYVQAKSVLDIACGVGYAAPILLDGGALSYQGVDIRKELVEYAQGHYGSARANFDVGDICHFDSDESYDVITSFETIEHIPEYWSAIENLYRLLKSRGVLLISSPNRSVTSPCALTLTDKPSNPYHAQEFTPDELLEVLRRTGFAVGTEDIFGQRQRSIYKNRYLRKLANILYHNPDEKATPEVRLMTKKVPRYFVIVARKP